MQDPEFVKIFFKSLTSDGGSKVTVEDMARVLR